jgi:PAS domain S-box-containing protein
VFLTDDAGVFTFICPNVDVIFGYVPDEVRVMTRIGRLLGEELFDRAELAARGEIRNLEREVTSKSGVRRTVLVHVKAVSIKGATVLYTCRDITERKQAEEELRAARNDLAHASRLALVGELMASIAHDITQPLTSILANARAGLRLLDAETRPADGRQLRDLLGDVCDQSGLAAEFVARLRALVRKRPMELRALDVNDVARTTLRLVEGDARRRGVTLCASLAPSLPIVAADRVCLEQVLLNLIVNAMDAMDKVVEEERRLTVTTGRREDTVELAVSDSGHGIQADRLPRLFDAFFTTKEDGLGLGLAIARSIVEVHHGQIWAEDRGGGGATFRFTVPVSA